MGFGHQHEDFLALFLRLAAARRECAVQNRMAAMSQARMPRGSMAISMLAGSTESTGQPSLKAAAISADCVCGLVGFPSCPTRGH
jgi:hypothetical protein